MDFQDKLLASSTNILVHGTILIYIYIYNKKLIKT